MRSWLPHLLCCLALVLARAPAGAGVSLGDEGKLTLGGDFRLRLESDWDSRRPDGSEREDRNRARVRARLGLSWKVTDTLTFGARLRSGSEASHQSPHITVADFDGNDTGDADFMLDKWFLERRSERLWGWAGRNGFPFWKQNEMFWDDDVTPAGLAGGWVRSLAGGGTLSLNLGYLQLPVGMTAFSGHLGAGQIVFEHDGAGADVTVAAGLFGFEADPDDPEAMGLRNGNGGRDYTIALVSAQVKNTVARRPLVLGLDYLHNNEDYSPGDAIAFANRDQTDGFVVSAQWGSAEKGSWQFGYWFARIEALAVNASYAQDDWIRWGSAVQTDSSDYQGHELRASYGLGDAGRLVARLFLVEAITSAQDGKRFRLDYNLGF